MTLVHWHAGVWSSMSTERKNRGPLHIHDRLPGPLVSLPQQWLESNAACLHISHCVQSPKPWLYLSLGILCCFFMFQLERRLCVVCYLSYHCFSASIFFFQSHKPLRVTECSWYTHVSHSTHSEVDAASAKHGKGSGAAIYIISSNPCSFSFIPKASQSNAFSLQEKPGR